MRIALGKATDFKAPNGWESTPTAYPDVTNCLNAVSIAEKTLLITDEMWRTYGETIERLQGRNPALHLVAASPLERTTALLTTLKLL